MMKQLLLFLLLIYSFTFLTAQNVGDTLYYEDFSDSTLSNWVVTNSTFKASPICSWRWDTVAPGGTFSRGILPINAPSSANGFITYALDSCNSLPGLRTNAAGTITSDSIAITPNPNVYIQFNQYYQYCCIGINELVIEVSTDQSNWTTFNAVLGSSVNTASSNPDVTQIDVSSVLGNSNRAYIRYKWTGSSTGFWMIDDVVILKALPVGFEEYGVGKFVVHPNPTTGRVQIQIDESKNSIITVRDRMGRQVYHKANLSSQTELDLRELAAGIYFITFETKNRVWTNKLIKN